MKLFEVIKKQYTHEVVDHKGVVKGKYVSANTARRGVDKHDNQYGAYVHSIRPIQYK